MRFVILIGFILSLNACRGTLNGGGQEVPYSYWNPTKPVETRYTECETECDWARKERQAKEGK